MEESRYSNIDLKFALLKCFNRGSGHQNRVNVLGRPYQKGALEHELEVKLTPRERGQASRCLRELEDDDLLRATHSDLANPLDWLEITASGRRALERKALDDLDCHLQLIAPGLTEIRHGAWSAASSHEPDSIRQAAHSARELITKVLHNLAPDAEVRKAPWFGNEDRVTRRHRIRLIMEKKQGRVSNSTLPVVETACELVENLYTRFSAVAHHAEPSTLRDQVVRMIRTSEDVLEDILIPESS